MQLKKIIYAGLTCCALISWSFVGASELSDAVQWGHDNGLTKYSTIGDFWAYDSIRRDEVTKFLVKFNDIMGVQTEDNSLSCEFSDLNQAWGDLHDIIKQACRLGIIKGAHGKVMPADNLTNEQIVTMVVRVVMGMQDESKSSNWSDPYYEIIKNLDIDVSDFEQRWNTASRGAVLTLLYRVMQKGHEFLNYYYDHKDSMSELDKKLQNLLDILDS